MSGPPPDPSDDPARQQTLPMDSGPPLAPRPSRPSTEAHKPADPVGSLPTAPAPYGSSRRTTSEEALPARPSGEPAVELTEPPEAVGLGSGPRAPLEEELPDLAVEEDTGSLVGQVLAGRYKVLDRLGSGGMSIVYLARHELLNKTVAIKVLKERLAGDKVSLTRFHREAKSAASIGNPHIVHITDYGFTDRGDAFIVMEHLEGQSLRQLVREQGALDLGRAVSIARQILSGLQAAHDMGVIHRDLKSDNVFLIRQENKDFVKILDFGISKIVHSAEEKDQAGLTSTGVVMGTPQYIAPEQANGLLDVDHRADLYALGVILYEMLTGALPFTGRTPLEILMKHVQEEPVPPRKVRPDLGIPADIEAIVLKALSKEPGDRFPSAKAMLQALPHPTLFPGGFTSGTLAAVPAARGLGSRTLPLAALFAALLIIAAVVVLLVVRRGTTDQTPDAPPPATLPAPTPAPTGSLASDSRVPDVTPLPTTPDLGTAPDRSTTARLEILVQPPRARIYLAGKLLGQGRALLHRPLGDRELVFLVRCPGYKPRELRAAPTRDQQLKVTLEPVAGRKEPATPGELRSNPYQTP